MEHDPLLSDGLEAERIRIAMPRKLPRRVLGRGTLALLVLLRVYVMAAIPLVGYAFVRALLASQH